MGALVSVEWKLGPKVVRRADDISTPATRRRATRGALQLCVGLTGEYQAVKRSEAPAFRRRVQLALLEMDAREIERRADQIRRLRAEVEAETVS